MRRDHEALDREQRAYGIERAAGADALDARRIPDIVRLVDIEPAAEEIIRLACAGVDVMTIEVVRLGVQLRAGRNTRRCEERDRDDLVAQNAEHRDRLAFPIGGAGVGRAVIGGVGLLRLPDAEEDAHIDGVAGVAQSHARDGEIVDCGAGVGIVGQELENFRILVLWNCVEVGACGADVVAQVVTASWMNAVPMALAVPLEPSVAPNTAGPPAAT